MNFIFSSERLYDLSFINKVYLWGARVDKWLKETGLFKDDQLYISGNNRMDVYRNYKDRLNLFDSETIGSAQQLVEEISKKKKKIFK